MKPPPQETDKHEPVCTQCGIGRASHPICQIIDGNKTVMDLCENCAAEWGKSSMIGFPDIRDAKCYYCGAQAMCGSMNHEWEQKARGKGWHFTCSKCFEIYSQLFLQRLEEISSTCPAQEHMQQMSLAVGETDMEVRAMANPTKI